MFKNYVKITFKLMLRNKLFTFIGLLAISMTLLFIIVVDSIVDYTFGPVKPETRLDRTLSVTMGRLEFESGGASMGPLFSPHFLIKNVKGLKTPEKNISKLSL